MAQEIKRFAKAQVSAFAGGVVDYLVMLLCVQVFSWHYVYGIIAGGIIGAIVNFLVNKYWSFKGRDAPWQHQIWRFILMVFGSIALKSLGTTLLTEVVGFDYRISRLIADALVAFGFNYLVQRHWVFAEQM